MIPTNTSIDVPCVHCGELCTGHIVDAQEHPFCCNGCKSVYEILHANDLCDYYQHDDHAGVSMRQRPMPADAFAALDDPSVARQLLEYSSESMHRVRLSIPSMHCTSCVWLLEQLDRIDSGVLRSTVDVMRKQVTIEFDPSRTTLRAIATMLTSIGYEPVVRIEAGASHLQQGGDRSAIRALYLRIGVAAFAAGNIMLFSVAQYFGASTMQPALITVFQIASIILSVPVLVFSASPWFRSAAGALRARRVNLDVPVSLGILVLFARSVADIAGGAGEGFLDSFAGLVLFLLVGRLFQQRAFDALSFDRTYRSFFPLSVRVERKQEEEVIPIEGIVVGDTMQIRNGEVIPCDSVLLGQCGYVDYSFVSGEALPVECTEGSFVYAGGRVVGAAMKLAAVKDVSHSYLASLWDSSSTRVQRSTWLQLSDRFGQWFTVFAIGVAVLGFLLWLPNYAIALNVFTAVLIIACPCALTLAAPITLGTAMGLAGRKGIFLKNIGSMLELERTTDVVFDKTGTLTMPSPAVRYEGRELTNEERRAVIAVAMQSAHPMSRAVAKALDDDATSSDACTVDDVAEHVGQGITGSVDGQSVCIGSHDFVHGEGAEQQTSASVWVSVDGRVVGAVHARPTIRTGIAAMIDRLRTRATLWLLSGDTDRDRDVFAGAFPPSSMYFSQRPTEKVDRINELRTERRHVLMVGDGLNDAGAMRAANVAIAVTDDAATLVPACDVIMRAHQLSNLDGLLRYARSMRRVIVFNFIISIAYNALGLTLALVGILTPLATAILMPVSSLTVIGVSVAGARWYARRYL
ncbi:MAG: heavy metal translocating P-type ATPase [Bacteroidetes bacterium]|nr:heavy metal translocating P-type ATPase [Bacteroidota bacterium]